MIEWIVVNGARIERNYFDENVREAKQETWRKEDVPAGHAHCLVCGIALTGEKRRLKSKIGILCAYCYEHFVKD